MTPRARAVLCAVAAALAGMAIGFSLPVDVLLVRLGDDGLHVSASRARFLTGRPLERLRDGNPVTFHTRLTLSFDKHATWTRSAIERFVFSYDLWEEKFSVARVGGARRSASRLDAAAAEKWCLDSLVIPVSGLPGDKPFWVRLEWRAEDAGEAPPPAVDAALSLTRLVDVFSRRSHAGEERWQLDAGPLRVADLGRK